MIEKYPKLEEFYTDMNTYRNMSDLARDLEKFPEQTVSLNNYLKVIISHERFSVKKKAIQRHYRMYLKKEAVKIMTEIENKYAGFDVEKYTSKEDKTIMGVIKKFLKL